MTNLRKAAEMALEALRNAEVVHMEQLNAMYALQEALAQPEQEPDEFCTATTEELMKELGCSNEKAKEIHDKVEALAQPEQKQWQNLTDDEIKEIVGPWGDTPIKGYTRKLFDQIEAKLKEKNT